MYNHELKSIFVHIPKTGGTTVSTCLKHSTSFNSAGHLGHFQEKTPWISVRHYPCRFLKKEYLDDYFKFAFVRNPWNLLVSSYAWWQKPNRGRKNKKIKQIINKMSFHEFIHSEWSGHINEVNTQGMGQHFWLSDKDGNIIVDFVGRVENLQEDFNTVCDRLGIPQKELRHKNKSKHKHYTEYYDDETREIVAEKYAKDIEYFGYKFGE